MFGKIPYRIFHTSDVLIVYVHLRKGGLVSKLTHELFRGKVFPKIECFILNVVLTHKLSESIAEPTTIFRVNVELWLGHKKREAMLPLYLISYLVVFFNLPCGVDRGVPVLDVLFVSYDTSLCILQGRHEHYQEKDCWSTHNEGDSNKITKKNLKQGVVHFIHQQRGS